MKLVKNSVQCLVCLEALESKYQHDFVMCKCENQVFVDGGLSEKIVNGKQYLNARITDDNGKRVGKMMSVEKHGHENCLLVLSDWLEMKKIEFGYGVSHGK